MKARKAPRDGSHDLSSWQMAAPPVRTRPERPQYFGNSTIDITFFARSRAPLTATHDPGPSPRCIRGRALSLGLGTALAYRHICLPQVYALRQILGVESLRSRALRAWPAGRAGRQWAVGSSRSALTAVTLIHLAASRISYLIFLRSRSRSTASTTRPRARAALLQDSSARKHMKAARPRPRSEDAVARREPQNARMPEERRRHLFSHDEDIHGLRRKPKSLAVR